MVLSRRVPMGYLEDLTYGKFDFRAPIIDGKKAYMVPLTRGRWTIIDFEDLIKITSHSWSFNDNRKGYAVRSKRDITLGFDYSGRAFKYDIKLHRFLLGLDYGNPLQGDHKNQISLDNRKCNLRIATKSDNQRNKSIRYQSPFKGVDYFNKDRGIFVAYIHADSIKIHLGNHSTEELAAEAYNKAALKYFGEFACLNQIPKGGG